ncbi:MAG TPA: KpsF/GutQ family sugar-phosphate isomerase [bacterium]|nr:KpsF/GutQ family sugar-phosphate isomerase [bacterium]
MADKKRIIESAKTTIKIESEALKKLVDRIDDEFVKAIELILNCKGRVVVTGVGKSGVIGRKITATFASTGTPSFFIHAGEGGHGDLGMIVRDDIVLALSYSGETEEVSALLPALKRMGVKIITITGNRHSTLAKYSDVVLNIKVAKEACPMGLAPTTSTTAALAMGDAIAVALINEKKFSSKDFALYHPAGALGKMLLLTVADLMHTGADIPIVRDNMTVLDSLYEISSKRLGVTAVIDNKEKLIGVFTDGDLRRLIENNPELLNQPIKKFMTRNPKIIKQDTLAAEAIYIMNEKKITSLFIIDNKRKPIGIIHMHDILKAGIR